jgi:opacity protein-like surface antigen
MRKFSSILHGIRTSIFVAVAAVLVLPTSGAAADDLSGLYVGGAIGQSHIEASGQRIDAGGNVYFDTGSFNKNHSAFKVTIGIRPISRLGAELAYMDLGHPSGSFNAYPADVNMKGVSAFGVLYLPVPIVDFFIKAGIARIQSEVNGTGNFGPNCSPTGPCPQYVGLAPFQLDRTNTSGAAGAGAQYRFGSLAVRAEYERFNAAGEHPTLLSLGLTWSF